MYVCMFVLYVCMIVSCRIDMPHIPSIQYRKLANHHRNDHHCSHQQHHHHDYHQCYYYQFYMIDNSNSIDIDLEDKVSVILPSYK